MVEKEISIQSICLWDDDSIAWIYDSFFSSLVLSSNQITNDMEAAYDIVQDFFIHLIDYRPLFENMSHLKSYLYNGVRNRSVSWLRHKRVIRANDEDLAHDEQFQLDNNGEEEFYTEEVYRQLFVAIDRLPQRQRDVFLLAIQGKRNSEIAAQLGIALETVKTLKKRGKQKLREMLSPTTMAVLAMMCMGI